jgi:AcrR family transcriptional regulator
MALTKRGEAARAALVEAAERMFAERGIEAVSLREVSAAAGQRNNSAAQYHFDDREGLVAAVYEARMQHVDARRHALVEELQADGRLDEVRSLVEAVVVPLVDVVAETGGWYGRFLARTRWDPFAWRVLQSLSTSTSFELVMRRLNRALDHLPRPVRHHRLDQLMTLVLGTIAGWEGAPERGARRLSREAFAADLVTTGVALVTAPVSDLTGAAR